MLNTAHYGIFYTSGTGNPQPLLPFLAARRNLTPSEQFWFVNRKIQVSKLFEVGTDQVSVQM